MAKVIKESDIDNAIDLLSKGITLAAAGIVVGINPDTLSRKIRARGIAITDIRPRPAGAQRLKLSHDEVRAMYESGISENATAKHFGVARAIIRRHLVEAGAHIRGQSEAETLKWAQMSDYERANQVRAAHTSTVGISPRYESLAKAAITREESPAERHIGPGEPEFASLLAGAGIPFRYQAAIDTYNIDFLVGTVAVELTTNACRYTESNADQKKRAENLLKRDIKTLAVVFDCLSTLINLADDIIAHAKEIDRLEAFGGEYWVIRCRSQDYTIVQNDLGQFSRIPAPIYFLQERKTIKLR